MCLGTASCKKDTTIRYNNETMGNVSEGTFVSDQGNIFNVVEKTANCKGDLLELERAYILCDVLNKTAGGQDNEYDVRLKAMAKVLTKDILTLGDEKPEEALVENPINVKSLWISGGYINFYIEFPAKADSETPHLINLIQQESETGYTFRLFHNANGETREDLTNGQLITAGAFVSFPINKVIQENESNITILWTWYKTYGSGSSSETELYGIEGTFTKDGFEHPTKGITPKTMAVIK